MSFPIQDYDDAVAALRAVIADRDAKGRNRSNDFYSQFLHGTPDIVFECNQRMMRMRGADELHDRNELAEQFIDMANYCLFGLMLLSKDSAGQSADPDQDLQQIHPPGSLEAWYTLAQIDPGCCSTAQPHQVRTADNTSS